MSSQSLTSRLEEMDPFKLDVLIAVGLTLLVWLQLIMLTLMRPAIGNPAWARNVPRPDMLGAPGAGVPVWLPYLVAAGVFLPLIIRREIPWLSLVLSGSFALVYALNPFPPAFTILGPMVAVYTVAAYGQRRHSALVAVLVAGLLIAAVVFAFSSGTRVVMEIIGAFVMLAAAAFLGDTAKSRRDYVAEVEQRALAAEQARDEETLRRIDEERIGIAREVHDIVAHSLSIVAVQASAAEKLMDDDPEQARESIANIRSTSKEALGELRSMLDVLRTGTPDVPMAPSADLTQLDQLIDPVREAGLDVEFDVRGDVSTVPAYASVSAYRIVQESLTNVVRHAQARHVEVAVEISPRSLELTVADDGKGPGGGEPQDGGGHGLRGMNERIEALGGTFESGPAQTGSGFRVAATIPLAGGAA
jgi:signal transduction histidine kinase